MLDQKTWEEFQNTGLLWLVNTFLHTFGWTLMTQVDDDGNVVGGVPCRTDYRGFTTDVNDEGYLKITDWLKENIDMLAGDVESLRKPVIEEAESEKVSKEEDENLTDVLENDDFMDENWKEEEEIVDGD